MKLDERCSAAAGNILLSYSMQEDNEAAAKGFLFLGVARDADGTEVHVFQMAPLTA